MSKAGMRRRDTQNNISRYITFQASTRKKCTGTHTRKTPLPPARQLSRTEYDQKNESRRHPEAHEQSTCMKVSCQATPAGEQQETVKDDCVLIMPGHNRREATLHEVS
jgi:hypothetical protein